MIWEPFGSQLEFVDAVRLKVFGRESQKYIKIFITCQNIPSIKRGIKSYIEKNYVSNFHVFAVGANSYMASAYGS